jgi:hypothetical protein
MSRPGSPSAPRRSIPPWALPVVVALIAVLLATPALAQAPEKERRFVYGLNLFNGVEYSTGFVPPAVDTIYVLADHDGVLDPKMTEVYFWPITNEFRADFTSLNELVPGRLEIAQGGQVVGALELTEYVVQFDRAAGAGNGRVFAGEEARASWERFLAERAAYLERLRAYSEARLEFNQRVEEVRSKAGAGADVVEPEPPIEPTPLSLYSTEIGRGFVLRLDAGEYTIRVRDDVGRIVPDSEKRLVAVAPRRHGVGYEVVAQEKWTAPEQANDPTDAIYTVPGGVAYLRPFAEQELNALAYARLQNPQDLGATANRWRWVHVAPLGPATLVVGRGDRAQRLEIEEFAVEQVPGAALGYRVVPFGERGEDPRAGRKPDITAYRVEAPAGRGRLSLRLVDADGRELPGSARELVAVSSVPLWQLALPVLVPLALGLSVALWRREQVQSARSLPPEQRRLLA